MLVVVVLAGSRREHGDRQESVVHESYYRGRKLPRKLPISLSSGPIFISPEMATTITSASAAM